MTTNEGKLIVSPSTLAAWMEDELASWEDHEQRSEGGPVRYPDGTLHVRELLGRLKTRLVWHNQAELHRLWQSADYHRAGGWDDRHGYRTAMGRIARALHAELTDRGA